MDRPERASQTWSFRSRRKIPGPTNNTKTILSTNNAFSEWLYWHNLVGFKHLLMGGIKTSTCCGHVAWSSSIGCTMTTWPKPGETNLHPSRNAFDKSKVCILSPICNRWFLDVLRKWCQRQMSLDPRAMDKRHQSLAPLVNSIWVLPLSGKAKVPNDVDDEPYLEDEVARLLCFAQATETWIITWFLIFVEYP